MNTGVIAAIALVPLAIGWIAGRRYERMVRGWSDYQKTKGLLAELLTAARALTGRAVGVLLLAAAIAALGLYLLATEGVA